MNFQGIISYVVNGGSGYIFSMLISDVIFFTATTYLLWTFVQPYFQQRKLSMELQEIAGSPPRHWYYGHFTQPMLKIGLSNWLVNMTSQYPVMMNFWYTFFLSGLYCHHPDSSSVYVNSGAPKRGINTLKPWLGDGILLSSGKKWFRNRRLITPAFHYSILKQYTYTFNDCVKIMIDKWDKKIGQNIEVSNDVSHMTLHAILKCAMSSDVNPQENSDHPYIKTLRKFIRLFMLRIRTPLHRPDWIYRFTKNGKESQKCIDILHKQTEEIIQKRKLELRKLSNCDTSNQTKGKKILDFLDVLLYTKDEDGNGLTDVVIRNEVDTFLFAGHDTTASGIQWAIHNLAKYPELQEKCRQEINYVVGDKENVEWIDIPKFVYFKMFLKESMRLNPPVYVASRKYHKPMEIHSSLNRHARTILPTGTEAHLSIYALHRNPHLWHDPEKFDPERFTKENISKRSPYAYLPFSAGNRNCIGQNFALTEMKIVLAQIIRRFKLTIKDNTPESKIARKVTLQSVSGVHVYIDHV